MCLPRRHYPDSLTTVMSFGIVFHLQEVKQEIMRKLLSGNEAIARGAYEYGVKVAAAYPGTPSTEILENISQYREIYAEWSPNEKVALEVALGASFTGIRTLAAMKHVGLNVASDPLMTSSYTGISGGLVIVVADDPGMHSSQNEQDSRNYARFAKVPLFEPSDSSEAKELISDALALSEQFDTPVLFRTTTRISHSKSIVSIEERSFTDRKPAYERNPDKYLMVPGYARKRRYVLEARLKELTAFNNRYEKNAALIRSLDLGIVTSSISYQYVMEAFDKASVLKLTMIYPFPDDLIREFAGRVKRIVVVEELDRFLTEHIRSLGIAVEGEEYIPDIGELNPDILERARKKLYEKSSVGSHGINNTPETTGHTAYFKNEEASGDKALLKTVRASSGKRKGAEISGQSKEASSAPPIPARPPVLCPGCPHRTVFHVLKAFKPIIIGDIGCYSLGGLAPLDSMDAIICMGAGVSAAMGVAKSGIDRPVVGIVGDSTFFHSGITGLVDIGYNRGNLTIIVLDNRITGMTGHQVNPGTGRTLMGEETFTASIEKFAQASGIGRIRVFDPYIIKDVKEIFESELSCGEASLLVSRRPCVLIIDTSKAPVYTIEPDLCNSCGICLKIGCPAIYRDKVKKTGEKERGWKAAITESLCTGCSVCAQLCPFDAIKIGKLTFNRKKSNRHLPNGSYQKTV